MSSMPINPMRNLHGRFRNSYVHSWSQDQSERSKGVKVGGRVIVDGPSKIGRS